MGQVELVACVLEQVGEPLPAVGRLEGDPGVAFEFGEELEEGGRIVGDPPRERLGALLVDHRDVRALAM
jgi:hypothetical protein